MKLKYFLLLIILIVSFKLTIVHSQTPPSIKNITLSTPATAGEYVARDWIKLGNGFQFEASSPTSSVSKIVEVIWNFSGKYIGWKPKIKINGHEVEGSAIPSYPDPYIWGTFRQTIYNLHANLTGSSLFTGWTFNLDEGSNYIKISIVHYSDFTVTKGETLDFDLATTIRNFVQGNSGSFEARIDENLLFDVEYLNSQPDIDRDLDFSLPVGAIPGAFNSATGAATYNIPIELPPGTMGMEPKLSIVYNSQGGTGLLGMGTDLAGLSAISRTTKTHYTNNTAGEINFNISDMLALDGNKLLLESGTYGIGNSTYSTENETFSRITANGSTEYGPEWFKVETKDGIIMEYGNSSDSRLEPNGTSATLVWKLSKVIDPNGNFMTYKYKKENNESVIDKIEYTGNGTTLTPYNSVTFLYEKKTDARKIHIAGKYLNNSLILRSIKVNCEDRLVRQYNFKYTRDVYSHLSKVELVNSEQETVNSTIFNWGEYNKAISVSQYTKNDVPLYYMPDGSDIITLPPDDDYPIILNSGDVNGDGIDDLVKTYTTWLGSYRHTAVQTLRAEIMSDGTLQMNSHDLYLLPPDVAFDEDNISYHSISAVHNIDGDATPDVVMPYFLEINKSLSFYVPNNDWVDPQFIRMLLPTTNEMPPYSISDLDNDGFDDFVIVEENGTYQRLSVGLNAPGNEWISANLSSLSGNTPQRIIIADFNADGLKDVFIKSEQTAGFYKNNAGQISTSPSGGLALPDDPAFLETGDFNGDGMIDFVICNEGDNPLWRMLINNGNWTFTNTPLSNITVESWGSSKDRLKVMDFDNDGKSDIIVGVSNPGMFSYFNVFWFKSTGDNMQLVKSSSTRNLIDRSKQFVIGDFNGDARADLIYDGFNCYNNNSTVSPRIYFSPNLTSDEGLLKAVVDGYNNKINLSYLPLTRKTPDNHDFYTGSFSGSLPLMVIKPPMYCLWKVTEPAVNGTTQTTEYSYDEVKVHSEGLGFLGFHQITAQNTVQNRKVVTTNTLDSYYKLSRQETVISTTASPVTNLSSNIINYTTVKQGSNYYTLTASTNEVDLSNSVINTTFTYEMTGSDYNGNVLSSLQKFDNNDNFYIKTEYSQYTPAGFYLPNKPKLVTVTRKHPDDPITFVTKVYNNYDAATGRLLSSINNYEKGDKEVITTYTNYNIFGLPETVTTSATGLTSIVKNYHYESKYRYVDQESDALGTTFYVFDPAYGTKVKTTDINGLVSRSIYDSWGSLEKHVSVDDLNSTYKLSWAEPGEGPANALYYSFTTKDGRPWIKTWYDPEGRALSEESIGFNNIINTTSYTYTPEAQVDIKTSYMGGLVTGRVDYNYFNDGRIQSENYLGGKTVSYQYTNKLVKTTTDGKTYEKDHDGWGNVSSVVEPSPGGTITYKYYSNGKPWKIIAPGPNSTITMYYDEVGNQNKLIDPDAGTIEYVYDAFGRLTSQKDERGNEEIVSYDYAGRIDYKRNKLNQVIDYQYVESGYGKGQLSKLLHENNGSFLMYEYDNLSRLWRTTKHIDASINDIVFEYGFDKGNIIQVKYPGNYIIDQVYDDYGNLINVNNGSNSIWTLNELTATKMKYSLGTSGMFTEKNFDSYGFMTSCSTKIGTNVIQYQYYDFIPVNGQLRSREDRRSSYMLKEQFEYDDLYRLTDWNITKNGVSIRNNNQTYKTNFSGNIDVKEHIGRFDYGTTYGPHSIETLSTTAGAPVFNDQVITYTDFNKVASIDENDYLFTFTYGPDRQRIKSEIKQNGTIRKTNYYGGLYEKVVVPGGETRELLYIPAGDGLAAVYMKSSTTGNNLYYVQKDHLGSIVSLTNGTGTTLEQYNYDPWGRRRNPTTWDYQSVTAPNYLTRGFTGHEHLDEINLINMNGRIYDPVLGMFLSPDNNIQAPDFSPNFNRYSYCLNNPLVYTDPDGEWIHIVIGAAIGGVINLGIKAYQGKIHNFGDGLAAFGIGAVAGAVGAATGGAAFAAAGGAAGGAGGFLAGAAGGMAGSAFAMPIQSMGNTAYFGDPMMTGQQYLLGIGIGGLLGGTTNGAIALFNGKTFWTGGLRGTGITAPGTTPALRLNDPEVELNTDGLRTQLRSMPDMPEQQTFLEIKGNDFTHGKLVRLEQIDFTLSPKQSAHYLGNISGKSPITIDATRLLNDLNKGNFQFVQLNARSMPIVKFNYNIGEVISLSGQNLGVTSYGTVHLNSLGQVHFVPWLPF